MMFRLNVPTQRGVVLNGVLFRRQKEKTADTVMIAITGIHGNFYSNPFYHGQGGMYCEYSLGLAVFRAVE